jgi:hypothetical protein
VPLNPVGACVGVAVGVATAVALVDGFALGLAVAVELFVGVAAGVAAAVALVDGFALGLAVAGALPLPKSTPPPPRPTVPTESLSAGGVIERTAPNPVTVPAAIRSAFFTTALSPSYLRDF